MKIPVLFERLLHEGGDSLRGAVLKSVGDFEQWLRERKLIFFPEYTDHGITHVESVLRGAEWLLSDDARKTLGSGDAAVLLLAVVLHDCAMHLSRDGFLQLVDRQTMWPPKRVGFLDQMKDVPWPDLWERFLREASRWDGQKRVDLFGKATPIRRPLGDAAWEEQDNLLIGEFLRRHHPRLAHEIAVCGVPGPGYERLTFTGLEGWLADLAGLVARSHGLDLRLVLERLPPKNRRDLRGVHTPLLMSVLRIADYLDIDASRAPTVLLKVRSLQSHVSRREWDKHAAVPYIKIDEDDPEAVYVDAQPEALETFAGLQDLFAGIQRELDAGWAVLGEVYKADPRYALSIRRLRSTLDDLDAFAARAAFVPVRARFDSAGGDLLTLLVGPLYDDEPAYGVRELIQNAVDACRELEDVINHQHDRDLDRPKLDADVVVTVQEEQDGRGWITVEDRGVGMSADVIVNYYLKAGASFRRSEVWHELHDDPDSRPRVARSGRFGLGVLATFLLGDEVEVSTRHVHDLPYRGIRFTARLDEPRIELRWCERPVGTTIRVRVTKPEVFDSLANAERWDWYRLQRPSVLRRVRFERKREEHRSAIPPGQEIALDHEEVIPHGEYPLPAPWRRLARPDFGEVLWSLQRESGWADVANGILLKRPDVLSTRWRVLWPSFANEGLGVKFASRADFFLFRPRVAVMEGTSLIPVDLRRTGTLGALPFHDDLVSAVCRDVLASLLVRAAERREDVLRQIPPSWVWWGAQSFMSFATLWHPAVSTDRDEHGTKAPFAYRVSSWLFTTDKGLTLEDPALQTEHTRLGVAFIVIMDRRGGERTMPDDELLARAFRRIPSGFPVGTQLRLGSRSDLENHRRSGGYASAVIVVPTRLWESAKRDRFDYRELHQLDVGNGWTIVWTGDDPTRRMNLEQFVREAPQERDLAHVLFLLPEGYRSREPRNPLSRLWRDLFYHGEIPYERALRMRVLARAYDELQEVIALWEKLASAEMGDRPVRASYWCGLRTLLESRASAETLDQPSECGPQPSGVL